jgi:protein-disulfide isomerase-like protein with CxxC motif
VQLVHVFDASCGWPYGFSHVLLAVGLAASPQSAFLVEVTASQASARLPLKRYIRSADTYRQALH